MLKRTMGCLCAAALAMSLVPAMSFADNANEQTYYIGTTVNAGLDTGYNESGELTRDDWHFGWELGQFTISGYTSETENAQGYPVFLKTGDDQIKLTFRLDQNLDALNGNESLKVNADTDGYNQHFGIDRTDFGRGTLIVRQTNYQNATGDPQIYTNYLEGVEQGAETEVIFLEEGNYEVQLDYELSNDPRKVGPVSLIPEYNNYKIDFYFEVRNGNCMVFPFDLATRSELTNEAYAPNGFYLDLAKSRYLDINVKKELLAPGKNGLVEDTRFNGPARDGDEYTEEGIYTITASNPSTDINVKKELLAPGKNGLVEDTRFNGPARDGDEYTEEGIYTITASNPSTGQETVKKIYVGNDPVLKCYAVTGLPIEAINARLDAGDVIAEDGMLITPEATPVASSEIEEPEDEGFPIALVALFAAAAFVIIIALVLNRRRKRPALPGGKAQLEAGVDPEILGDGEEENR